MPIALTPPEAMVVANGGLPLAENKKRKIICFSGTNDRQPRRGSSPRR